MAAVFVFGAHYSCMGCMEFLFGVCCMVCRKWRRIFMETDGAGLKRVASNDGKFGEWDGTALEEGGSLEKKLTEWRRERSEGSRGED
jgi:hypothetical protein